MNCHNCDKNLERLHHHVYEDEDQQFRFCMECVEEIGMGMPDEEVCPDEEHCHYCLGDVIDNSVGCEGCDENTKDYEDWYELPTGGFVCPSCILEYELKKCSQCQVAIVSTKEDGFEVPKPNKDGCCPDCYFEDDE